MGAARNTTTNRSGVADEDRPPRDEECHRRNLELVGQWRCAQAAGDETAAEALFARLVEENAGLASWWARRYAGVCVQESYHDLELLAREGLEQAIATWDPARGAALSTWSALPIRTRLQRRVVALYGRRFAPVARIVVQARRQVEAELGRAASSDEVGAHAGLVAERVEAVEAEIAAIRNRARAVRLDDDRFGDRHQRVGTETGSRGGEAGGGLAEMLAECELPARWERMARHIATATRTGSVEDAVASYAATIGTTAEDVSAELAQLIAHLGGVQ